MTEEIRRVERLLTGVDEIVEELPTEEPVAEVPPPEPALDAARAYRDKLIHRPMYLDPEKGAVPDLSPVEWEWLKAYRKAERRGR